MNRSCRSVRFLAIALILALASPTAEALARGSKAPKATKARKRLPPNSNRGRKPITVRHHQTAARRTYHHYAGRAYHSRTWYRHHRHRRWAYEVRFRSRVWATRAFATRPAAMTFMTYLRYHHFERHLRNVNGTWLVSFRNPHSHHYGTYSRHDVAQRVEVSLRQHGFYAWLRWHRIYF